MCVCVSLCVPAPRCVTKPVWVRVCALVLQRVFVIHRISSVCLVLIGSSALVGLVHRWEEASREKHESAWKQQITHMHTHVYAVLYSTWTTHIHERVTRMHTKFQPYKILAFNIEYTWYVAWRNTHMFKHKQWKAPHWSEVSKLYSKDSHTCVSVNSTNSYTVHAPFFPFCPPWGQVCDNVSVKCSDSTRTSTQHLKSTWPIHFN